MNKAELLKIKKDLGDEFRIREDDIYERVESLLLDKVAAGGPKSLKSGDKITKEYLEDVERDQWFEIRLKDDESQSTIRISG